MTKWDNLDKMIIDVLYNTPIGVMRRIRIQKLIKEKYGLDIPRTTIYDCLKELLDNGIVKNSRVKNKGRGSDYSFWRLSENYISQKLMEFINKITKNL